MRFKRKELHLVSYPPKSTLSWTKSTYKV